MNDDDDDDLDDMKVAAAAAAAVEQMGYVEEPISRNNSGSSSSPSKRQQRPSMKRGLSIRQRASIRQSLRTSIRSSQSSSGSFKAAADNDGGDGKRPSLAPGDLVRQQSWYKDLKEQGMTSADIAALLGEDGSEGDMAFGGNDEALLEQHSIMAHSEARRRLVERMGHDPWEQQLMQKKKPPASDSQDEAQRHILFPTVESSKSIPKNEPAISTPTQLFSWNPNQYIHPKVARTPGPDLHVGEPVPKASKAAAGKMIVKCLGCRQSQSVDSVACTLLRCSQCRTVSPAAASTRK